jgi:hypothetical protein
MSRAFIGFRQPADPDLDAALQKIWDLGCSGSAGMVDPVLRALYIGINKGTLNLIEKDVIRLSEYPPEIIRALAKQIVDGASLKEANERILKGSSGGLVRSGPVLWRDHRTEPEIVKAIDRLREKVPPQYFHYLELAGEPDHPIEQSLWPEVESLLRLSVLDKDDLWKVLNTGSSASLDDLSEVMRELSIREPELIKIKAYIRTLGLPERESEEEDL